MSAGGKTWPAKAPWPGWLENCTVLMAVTSAPRRWSGNKAAALTTWPAATQLWMDRIFKPVASRREQPGGEIGGNEQAGQPACGVQDSDGGMQPDPLQVLQRYRQRAGAP